MLFFLKNIKDILLLHLSRKFPVFFYISEKRFVSVLSPRVLQLQIMQSSFIFIDHFSFNSFFYTQAGLFIGVGGIFFLLIWKHLYRSFQINFFQCVCYVLLLVFCSFLPVITSLAVLFLVFEAVVFLIVILALLGAHSEMSIKLGLKYLAVSAFITASCFFFLADIIPNFYSDNIFGGVWDNRISARENCLQVDYRVSLGIIILCVFFFVKLGAAPFHMWLIDIYSKLDYFSFFFVNIFVKFSFTLTFLKWLNCYMFLLAPDFVSQICLFIGVVGLWVGSIQAVLQTEIKKVLGLSGVFHLGLVFVASAFVSEFGAEIALTYILIYCFTLFLVSLCARGFLITKKDFYSEVRYLSDLQGALLRNRLILVFFFLMSILSFAGIPPLPGFFAKLLIFFLVVDQSKYFFGLVLLIPIFISFVYYLRFIYYGFTNQFLVSFFKKSKGFVFQSFDIFFFKKSQQIQCNFFQKLIKSFFFVEGLFIDLKKKLNYLDVKNDFAAHITVLLCFCVFMKVYFLDCWLYLEFFNIYNYKNIFFFFLLLLFFFCLNANFFIKRFYIFIFFFFLWSFCSNFFIFFFYKFLVAFFLCLVFVVCTFNFIMFSYLRFKGVACDIYSCVYSEWQHIEAEWEEFSLLFEEQLISTLPRIISVPSRYAFHQTYYWWQFMAPDDVKISEFLTPDIELEVIPPNTKIVPISRDAVRLEISYLLPSENRLSAAMYKGAIYYVATKGALINIINFFRCYSAKFFLKKDNFFDFHRYISTSFDCFLLYVIFPCSRLIEVFLLLFFLLLLFFCIIFCADISFFLNFLTFAVYFPAFGSSWF